MKRMPWKKNLGVYNHESVGTRKTCDTNQPSMGNQGYKTRCFGSNKGK